MSQNVDMEDPRKFFYFGYGYNLNSALFKERLKKGKWLPDKIHKTGALDDPEPIDLGTYILPEHKFSYDLDLEKFHEKGSAANVSEVQKHLVYGVLYRITEKQLKRLDRSEEVPRIYMRKLVKVYQEGHPQKTTEAWIDIGRESAVTNIPHPQQDYIDEIVNAAQSRHFPPSYIDQYLRFPNTQNIN